MVTNKNKSTDVKSFGVGVGLLFEPDERNQKALSTILMLLFFLEKNMKNN